MGNDIRSIMWREGRWRLPAMPGTQVYTTKLEAGALQAVQVDLFRDGLRQRLTIIDDVRWDKFPSEELLAKIALVME